MAMTRANSEGKLCYFDAEGQTAGHACLYRDGKTLDYSRKQHDKAADIDWYGTPGSPKSYR
jgi:hypothetical protein